MDGSAGDGRPGLSRRDLLKRAGVVGVAAAVPTAAATAPTAEPAEQREQLESFTFQQAQQLEALVDRLIPADDTGPGARQARVVRYIDRALSGELSYLRDTYTAGLEAVEAHAQAVYGLSYVNLADAQKDAVLRAFETGVIRGPATPAEGGPPARSPFDPRSFFALLRELTLQGMFGDPYHGGNAGFVGWDLISYPGIKLNVPAREQALNALVEPAHRSAYDYDVFNPQRAARRRGRRRGASHGD